MGSLFRNWQRGWHQRNWRLCQRPLRSLTDGRVGSEAAHQRQDFSRAAPMPPEVAQQALRRLSVLLRRRGTSPELGKALRRAVRELDGVLMGKEEAERQAALRSATAELRACLDLIDGSNRPADLEQREGTAEALALLVPLESPEDVAPAPVESPPQPEPTRRAVAPTLVFPEPTRPAPLPMPPAALPAPPPAAPLAPELRAPAPKRDVRAPLDRPKLDRPKKTKAVISVLLSKLASLYSRRRGPARRALVGVARPRDDRRAGR